MAEQLDNNKNIDKDCGGRGTMGKKLSCSGSEEE